MSPIIQLEKLSKHFQRFDRREGVWGSVRDLFHREYKTVKAVDEISCSIHAGELVGYIGANGAGKSTSIKMMTGILQPSSGSLSILGYHPSRDRKSYVKHIGVVFGQRTQLWWDIAVIESLRLLGKIYEVPAKEFETQLAHLSEVLGLEEFLRTPVRKLSLGQRMRADLAASLIHRPKVLFLDEPSIGLDAVAKQRVRQFLRHVNQELGTTILLTTHDLGEIEELCKRILIIDQGKLLYDGSLQHIKSLPGMKRKLTLDFLSDDPQQALREEFGEKITISPEGANRLVIAVDPKVLSMPLLIQYISSHFEILDLSIAEPSIEEIVMKIYQEGRSFQEPSLDQEIP